MIQPVFAAPQSSFRTAGFNHTPHDRMRDTASYRNGRYEHQTRNSDNRGLDRISLEAGTTLPADFRVAERQIDLSNHPRLSQPSRYQQWVRVKDKYVLLNVLTNTVIKVVSE